jgi:hypothetical protein
MDRKDLSVADWAQHLREELMDGLVYLTRLKKDIIALEEELNALKSEKKSEDEDFVFERKAGTTFVYTMIPKPNETYTDEEPIIRKKYNWHR